MITLDEAAHPIAFSVDLPSGIQLSQLHDLRGDGVPRR